MTRYPTFSEIEDELGDLRNDPAYESLAFRIYWGDTPYDEQNDEGYDRPLLRSSGDVIESVAEVADLVVSVIEGEIQDWNGEDAVELLEMIERMKAWLELTEIEGDRSPDQVVIDLLYSTPGLFTEEYAERVEPLIETFTIWACDKKGLLLLGDRAETVQYLEDIEDQVKVQAISDENDRASAQMQRDFGRDYPKYNEED